MSGDLFQSSLEFEAAESAAEAGESLLVDIDGYEGPLHVLLALARTQKVDLLKLSITRLAEQYLAFVQDARKRRFSLVADYLVMAAWLAFLKSRLLLPKPERPAEKGMEPEEMAAALAFRLMKLEAMRKAVDQMRAQLPDIPEIEYLAAFVTHSEVLDAILYSVFPNFAPWAGFRPNVTYRFLPHNDSHEICTMEIMLLMRYPTSQARPRDASVQFVPADQTLAQTPGIEPGLARVFDQDFSNLPFVQQGLRSLQSGHVQLANYQEVRIRQFHQTMDKYLGA